MSGNKTLTKRIKLSVAKRTAAPAPRWVDLKVYGLGRARFRSVKRFVSRHWRKRGKVDV